jgi:hypothetical protein
MRRKQLGWLYVWNTKRLPTAQETQAFENSCHNRPVAAGPVQWAGPS